jgi:RNA polymerase sigma factor (sigma-70 family)
MRSEIVVGLPVEQQIVGLIPALRAFARTFHQSPSDADDLVQETLVKALSNIDRFETGTRLKSWLFTIMRNTFCTRFRVGKREILGAEDCASTKGSIAADQEWHVRGHELEAACTHLAEPYRSAFEFVFLDGRSYEEAADHFHCPMGTIKSRVNRARKRLAHDLGEDNAG